MMTDDDQKAVSAVLDFWFGAPDSEEYGNTRMEWFKKDDSFDDQVRTILLPLHDKAVKGELNHWVDNAWSGLALCIVLDQAPRNIFRNSSLSFASDAKAREIAHQLVSAGLDQVVLPVMRTFIYLPFEHSEILEDQKLSMKLFEALGSVDLLLYAQRHYDIVERFGRFPHRNEVLGRENTSEEGEFLSQPNSSF